jgi:two-component system, LytTR family, sensor kinase
MYRSEAGFSFGTCIGVSPGRGQTRRTGSGAREGLDTGGAAASIWAVMLVLWAFLFWTALGLFFASQMWLLGEGRVTWAQAMVMAMPQWYVWGLLTPGIVAVDRWLFAGRHSIQQRLAWQLPLGVGWTLLALNIRLLLRFLPGRQLPPSITSFFLQRFYWDLLIYAVIAGIAIARDYARRTREQERQMHQMQLEALELQRTLAEARLQALRSQLQPHFLFNALNTISALTESDPKSARRLMEQLGQLLRVSLRHASTPLVTLAEELTFLDDYLAIESVRFEGRIAVSVRAEDDTLDAMVPSFLLQPLVENAIRHGVGPRLSGGRINVTAARENGHLRLQVCDDGLGLATDWTTRRDAGVGLRNTAARLEQLYPQTHTFRVEAGPSARGVDVAIELPLRLQTPAAPNASSASSASGASEAPGASGAEATDTVRERVHAWP